MEIEKKTVWITGASSGIGMEFARAYAKKGYRLILTARRKARLDAIARSLGTDCRVEVADLSGEEECYNVCKLLQEETIDIFINNAGFGTCGSFADTDLSKEVNMIAVNVTAVHILCKQVLLHMKKRGRGTILNVASSAGLLPGGPYMATYYATKSYVVSLTKGIAEELRLEGSKVYVCALCPGPVDTEFNENADVVFALKGISPEQCVADALRGMKKKKNIIVPGTFVRLGSIFSKVVPDCILLPLIAGRQKKKTGA